MAPATSPSQSTAPSPHKTLGHVETVLSATSRAFVFNTELMAGIFGGIRESNKLFCNLIVKSAAIFAVRGFNWSYRATRAEW